MSRINAVAELLDSNILLIYGEVNQSMFRDTLEALIELEQKGSPPIEVRICSDGGRVTCGLDIYDSLRRYAGEKTGVVYSVAWSMGAVILQACDIRTCLPHARVRIHYVSEYNVSYGDYSQPEKMQERENALRKSQQHIDKIMMRRTGKTKKQLDEENTKDEPMCAETALAFGLIDSIQNVDD